MNADVSKVDERVLSGGRDYRMRKTYVQESEATNSKNVDKALCRALFTFSADPAP